MASFKVPETVKSVGVAAREPSVCLTMASRD